MCVYVCFCSEVHSDARPILMVAMGRNRGLLCLREARECILKEVGDQLMHIYMDDVEEEQIMAQELVAYKVLAHSWQVLPLGDYPIPTDASSMLWKL